MWPIGDIENNIFRLIVCYLNCLLFQLFMLRSSLFLKKYGSLTNMATPTHYFYVFYFVAINCRLLVDKVSFH